MKKIIGFLTLSIALMIMGCNEEPAQTEVVETPTEVVESQTEVIVVEEAASEEAGTSIKVNEDGFEVESDKVDVSVTK